MQNGKRKCSFTDTEGREWVIRIDVPSIREVYDNVGVIITDLVDTKSEFGQEVSRGHFIVHFVDALWVLCREQADGVNEVEFAKSLGGGVISDALEAVVEACVNFTRPSGTDAVMALYRKGRKMADENEKLLEEAMETGVMDDLLKEEESPMIRKLRVMVKGAKSSSNSSPNCAELLDSIQEQPE